MGSSYRVFEGYRITGMIPAAAGWRVIILDTETKKPNSTEPIVCWVSVETSALANPPQDIDEDIGDCFIYPAINYDGSHFLHVVSSDTTWFGGILEPGEELEASNK